MLSLRHALNDQTFLDKQQRLLGGLDLIAILKELRFWNIIHRDIKPANLCLQKAKGGLRNRSCLTLIDFGCAEVAEGAVDATSDDVMPKSYRGPELWAKTKTYTWKVDEWPMACVLYEVLSGAKKPLFNGPMPQGLYTVLGPVPNNCSVTESKSKFPGKSCFTDHVLGGKMLMYCFLTRTSPQNLFNKLTL